MCRCVAGQDDAERAAVQWHTMIETELVRLRLLKKTELLEVCKSLKLHCTAKTPKDDLVTCYISHYAATAVVLSVAGKPSAHVARHEDSVVDVTESLYTRTLAATAAAQTDKDSYVSHMHMSIHFGVCVCVSELGYG